MLCLVAVIALASFACGSHLLDATGLNDEAVNALVRSGLESFKKIMKKNEPYKLSPVPAFNFNKDDTDVKMEFTNITLYDTGNLEVGRIENSVQNQSCHFSVMFPRLHVLSNFNISGQVNGQQLNCSGGVKAYIIKLELKGFVQWGTDDDELFIETLDLDCDLDNAKFKITRPSFQGVTIEDVNLFMNYQLLHILKKNRREINEGITAPMITIANQFLEDKSLIDLTDLLNDVIQN